MNVRGLVIMAIGLAVTGCTSGDRRAESPASVRVTTQVVRAVDIPARLSFSGTVQGDKRATISTKIMGQVLSVYVQAGDKVSAGQPLLKIKSDDLDAKKSQVRANKTEAEAALKNVEVNYNRIKDLYPSGSATKKELDDVEAAYLMAKARVKAVEEMEKEIDDALGYSDVVSPFDGAVVQKMTEVGNTAAPGVPLLTIEDTRQLKIFLNVPETEIHRFSKNQTVAVSIDAADVETTGQIMQISPGGSPGSRQYEVQAMLNDLTAAEKARVRSGMFARASLKTGTSKRVLVADSLIVRRGQLEGVYTLLEGNIAVLRWVRTGVRFEDKVEILSGLSEGESIVVSFDGQLKDGSKAEVAL